MRTAVCSFGLLVPGSVCWDQPGTGYITGRVSDPGSSAVPDASLAVAEISTGQRMVVAPNSSGNSSAGPLKVGTYHVSENETGFKEQIAGPVPVRFPA